MIQYLPTEATIDEWEALLDAAHPPENHARIRLSNWRGALDKAILHGYIEPLYPMPKPLTVETVNPDTGETLVEYASLPYIRVLARDDVVRWLEKFHELPNKWRPYLPAAPEKNMNKKREETFLTLIAALLHRAGKTDFEPYVLARELIEYQSLKGLETRNEDTYAPILESAKRMLS